MSIWDLFPTPLELTLSTYPTPNTHYLPNKGAVTCLPSQIKSQDFAQ